MDTKLLELIEAAVKETERGRLEWTAFDSESFRAKIGSGYLHIQRGSTEVSDDADRFYPRATYSVQVSDAQGRVVSEDDVTEGFQGAAPFARLFVVARKSALASDRVIEDMLHLLRNDPRP
ncbi:MAG: hypothetical protein J0I06_23280 [Planctomycetes bacterium]|nr:hypothetical protein [Planctomycetota bacterium]